MGDFTYRYYKSNNEPYSRKFNNLEEAFKQWEDDAKGEDYNGVVIVDEDKKVARVADIYEKNHEIVEKELEKVGVDINAIGKFCYHKTYKSCF